MLTFIASNSSLTLSAIGASPVDDDSVANLSLLIAELDGLRPCPRPSKTDIKLVHWRAVDFNMSLLYDRSRPSFVAPMDFFSELSSAHVGPTSNDQLSPLPSSRFEQPLSRLISATFDRLLFLFGGSAADEV